MKGTGRHFIYLAVAIAIAYGVTQIWINNTENVNHKLRFKHNLYGRVELTIRMGVTEKFIKRLLCCSLRSAVLSWNPNYGDVVLILDAGDKNINDFTYKLRSLSLPFSFRFVYENPPKKEREFVKLAQQVGRPYGYIRQLYSSFLMDMYTNASVIAWIDTDGVFTVPVIDQSIMRNGKPIVKGMYTIREHSWMFEWNKTTALALGYPMVSDFMTYFPVYVFPSTIRKCRLHMMKRLGAEIFEDAYIRIGTSYVSPVNIIMSYAYYFERDLYEWHIDIGKRNLQNYNLQHLPKHPLLETDILPALHETVHISYYSSRVDPIEQGICYTQMYMGMDTMNNCKRFNSQPNMQLFEFCTDPLQNHLQTWCREENMEVCKDMITKRYEIIKYLYKTNELMLQTNGIRMIEDFAIRNYQINCPVIKYVPFI